MSVNLKMDFPGIPEHELPKRKFIRYVFLDVVGFTRPDRSDEDMAQIILTLNEIVEHALVRLNISKASRILLPTGDGMCIAITGKTAHDIHIQLALLIRESADGHNALHMRKGEVFQLTIAVHQSEDFVLRDINKKRNVFGHGINTAARLLSACEPSHIVASLAVHQNTCKDPKYMKLYGPEESKTIKGQSVRYHSLGLGLGEGFGLLQVIGRLKARIGAKLTLDDIYLLEPNDVVYHSVYGPGTIKSIGPKMSNLPGRQVVIEFRERIHSIRLTNEKGNYHQWV